MKCLKFFSCALLMGISSICTGQDSYLPADDLHYFDNDFLYQDDEGYLPCADYNLVRLEMGYSFGEFIALNRNYVEAGLFIAPEIWGHWQPFVDLRWMQLSSKRAAANGGLGMRYFNECSNSIYGANAYYDYQSSRFGNFQWVGAGVEALGESFDFRLNGHYCLSGFQLGKHVHSEFFADGTIEFFQLEESPISGAEAEFGYHFLRHCAFEGYGFAGPYYYRTDNQHYYGGFVGLKLDWMKYLSLEGQVSYDHIYRTQAQGKLLLSYSLNSLFDLGLSEEDNFKDFLAQPVRRHKMLFIRIR